MQPGRLQPPRPDRPPPGGFRQVRPRAQARRGPGRAARAPLLQIVLLAVVLLALPAAPPARATEGYAQAEVIVHGKTLRVDVADTPQKQALGLGGRKHLGPDEGMLFVYTERGRQAFWMRGMVIPIDIIWLDNRRVVHIEHNVPPPAPGSDSSQLPTYQPAAAANFVLELAAGRAKSLGLRVGDRVQYRFDVR